MRNKILIATLMVIALIATACSIRPTPTPAPTGSPAATPQGGAPAATAPAQPTAAPAASQPATSQPAAAQPAAAGKDPLAGTSWILATLNGKPALTTVAVTLNLVGGRAAGSDGCNSYSTSYTADSTNIKINQPMATTMMACPDPITSQATAYLAALGQAATYKTDGKQLTLFDASGTELATFNAQSRDLAGTSWIVTGYNNGRQAVVSVVVGTKITANFGSDGILSGNGSCNDYNAAYETTAANIQIGPVISTRKACEPSVMEQEMQYFAALNTAATYRIDGNQMEMRTKDGALAVTFVKAQASQPAGTGPSGTSWDVTGYNNGKQAVVSVIAGTKITAIFGTDGTLSGFAGCNNYSASYKTDGNKISIGPAAATRMFCAEPAGVMDQEAQYLAALGTAATYRIDGSKMELRTADGALAVSLQQAATSQKPAAGVMSAAGLQPQQISLDTQGLPYSWQAVSVPATPYNASQPPGPVGLPEHIEILFGVTKPADRQPGSPIMYIIPVDAYRQMWDSNGDPGVSLTIARIYTNTVALPSPAPTSGWPALPPEEIAGYNDLAVQVGRAASNQASASKSGFRLVGRWAQSANPVSNQGMKYVYQGFTNDGKYLVAFFYPVTTTQLAQTGAQVSPDEMSKFSSDPMTYLQQKAAELNALPPNAWDPDLKKLDALVGSLQIQGMKPAGLLDQPWTWVGTEAIGGPLKPLADPSRTYQVTFNSDGTLAYKADCNIGSGTFTYDGGMVGNQRTTLGPTTLAECNDGGQSQQFVNGLMASQNYKVRPGGTPFELVLPAGGGSLIFETK